MAQEEQKYYQLAVSGPPVVHSDVEADTAAVEVVVSWGDVRDVLTVAHVTPEGRFLLGDDEATDFMMNEELLGAPTFSLIQDGRLHVPAGATGMIKIGGEESELRDIDMNEGMEATLLIGEFRILVRGVKAGKKIASRSAGMERQPLLFVGGTMAVTALLLGIMSLTPPHGMAMTHDQLDTSNRLISFAMDAQELVPDEIEFTNDASGGDEGGAERGDEGEMGDIESPETGRAYALEGRARPEERQLSREERQEQATTAGILGVLRTAMPSINQPTSVYGADTAIGSDPMSALGALIGVELGDNHGYGGLGLRGTGRHAGGDGLGTIGLGRDGIGRGLGCEGDGPCLGSGRGPSGDISGLRRHTPTGPIMRPGTPEVMGGLSKETIRRVVQRHRNQVKFCYERALQSNPELAGRVTTRFVISPTGAVAAVSISGSSLNHAATEACVRDVVRTFSFPQPDNAGAVSVTYPFTFSSN